MMSEKEKYIDMILAKLQGQLDRQWDNIKTAMSEAEEDADPNKKFVYPISVSIKLIPGTKAKVHTILSFTSKYKDDDGETPISDDQIAMTFKEKAKVAIDVAREVVKDLPDAIIVDDETGEETIIDNDFVEIDEPEQAAIEDDVAPEIDIEEEIVDEFIEEDLNLPLQGEDEEASGPRS